MQPITNIFEEIRPGLVIRANDARPQVRVRVSCGCGAALEGVVLAEAGAGPVIESWQRQHSCEGRRVRRGPRWVEACRIETSAAPLAAAG